MASTSGLAASTAPLNCAAFSGSAAERAHDPAVELLPHPGHPEHELGSHLPGVGRDLARVRAAGDLVAQERLLVVAGHALGDVGHRQVRDQALAGEVLEVDAALEALDRPGHVAGG